MLVKWSHHCIRLPVMFSCWFNTTIMLKSFLLGISVFRYQIFLLGSRIVKIFTANTASNTAWHSSDKFIWFLSLKTCKQQLWIIIKQIYKIYNKLISLKLNSNWSSFMSIHNWQILEAEISATVLMAISLFNVMKRSSDSWGADTTFNWSTPNWAQLNELVMGQPYAKCHNNHILGGWMGVPKQFFTVFSLTMRLCIVRCCSPD